MNKLLKDLEKGDKIYEIEISSNRLVKKQGESLIKTHIIRSADMNGSFFGKKGLNIVFESGTSIYPENENLPAYVYVNSRDTSIYNSLNAYVYGTSKRACIEASMEAIKAKNEEQTQTRDKFNKRLEENELTLRILEENLETADFPETVLEFAEMALE